MHIGGEIVSHAMETPSESEGLATLRRASGGFAHSTFGNRIVQSDFTGHNNNTQLEAVSKKIIVLRHLVTCLVLSECKGAVCKTPAASTRVTRPFLCEGVWHTRLGDRDGRVKGIRRGEDRGIGKDGREKRGRWTDG